MENGWAALTSPESVGHPEWSVSEKAVGFPRPLVSRSNARPSDQTGDRYHRIRTLPGPPPGYRPEFPPDFLTQAQTLARRRTLRSQLRQRAELALLLHDQSLLSNPAALGRLHPNSVRAWPKRWAAGDREPKTGIKPFGRLMAQVMEREPYRTADRVFWVVDNGSSDRGASSVRRRVKAHENVILVHTPVHWSWLNRSKSTSGWCSRRCSRRTSSPAWMRSRVGSGSTRS